MRPLTTLAALVACAYGLFAEPPDDVKSSYGLRRARLQRQLGEGLALVPGAPQAEPFRQDNDFWYLTGLDWPDAVLVLSREGAWVFAGEGARATPPGFEGVLPLEQLDLAASRYASDGLWIPGGRSEFYSASTSERDRTAPGAR